MSVPEYQEIRGKMMTGHVEYQIVVVTRLSAFKSAQHKPEDVVQFVVSRKYSEIEEFYQKICDRFPKLSLPPFPRKLLFVGESDIRDRRAAFNDLVKSVSKDKELAVCPELLEFLGSRISDFVDSPVENIDANQPDEEDFFKNETSSDEVLPHITSRSHNKPVEEREEEEEEEEEDLDPLGIMKTKKIKKPALTNKIEDSKKKPKASPALFDDEVDPEKDLFEPMNNFSSSAKKSFLASGDIKLFEDQDLGGTVKLGDSLLLPTACNSDHLFKPCYEEATELFRVQEDLEKLLELGVKPKNKPKPKIPEKPRLPKKSNNSDDPLGLRSQQREPNIQAMDETDILQYIQENEPAGSDSLSLF
ncbi:HCLS1-binding protein 3 isoform X2 [Ascaphus truei]